MSLTMITSSIVADLYTMVFFAISSGRSCSVICVSPVSKLIPRQSNQRCGNSMIRCSCDFGDYRLIENLLRSRNEPGKCGHLVRQNGIELNLLVSQSRECTQTILLLQRRRRKRTTEDTEDTED